MIEEEEEEKKKTTAGIEVESSGWGKASEETIRLSEKCLKIMIHSRKHNSYKEARVRDDVLSLFHITKQFYHV